MAFHALNQLENLKEKTRKFDCGEQTCNNYIKKFATQDIKKNRARTYCFTNDEDFGDMLGYFTVTTSIVEWGELPESLKLPKHPTPVALIARLAVHKDFQRQKLGYLLLMDAIAKIVNNSSIPFPMILVDAIDESIVAFYEKFGFKPLHDDKLRLYISYHAAKDLVQSTKK